GGDAVIGHAARHDAAEMIELGIDVQRDAVIADPVTHPDADRGDLVLMTAGPRDPSPDPAVAALAPDVEPRQGADHPFLEPPDMAAHIAPPRTQFGPIKIEHHIGNALAGAVIGVLPAAAALVDRQALWIEQVRGARAGAGGVERRVL